MPEHKCPKCNGEMEETEQDYSSMTEGQQADYDGGFNRTFECSECGYNALIDLTPTDFEDWEDPEVDELVEIIKIDPKSFEDVIENALKNKCFVEAISLIHNTIEAYLKRKIEVFLISDSARLQLLKEKFKPQYLKDYNTICYILGLIQREDYETLQEFNIKRNKVVHELLTKSMTIEELRNITRKGREMQMKLSPLNHSEQDIKNIMAEFDRLTN